MTDKEFTINKDGVSLKGDIVDEIKKPLAPLMDTTENIFRLAENIVGLPVDFINHHLYHFRKKYKEGYNEIPDERKTNPSFRIGCNVIKNAALSKDEPEMQELFAKLLVSASDTELNDKIHPAYASVLNELTSIDAKLLNFYATNDTANINDIDHIYLMKSESNLMRLGLIEYYERAHSQSELRDFVGKNNYYLTDSVQQLQRTTVDLINDVQRLKNKIIKDLENASRRKSLQISRFGRDFVAVVLAG